MKLTICLFLITPSLIFNRYKEEKEIGSIYYNNGYVDIC